MKLIINTEYNEVYGVLFTFMVISNYDYFKLQVEEKWNMNFDNGIKKDIKEIADDPIFLDAKCFVNMEIPTKEIFIDYKLITKSKSLDEYFKYLLEQDEHALRENIFKTLGFDELIEHKYEKYIKSFLEKIDKVDYSNDIKWYLLSFIQNPKIYLENFIRLVKQYLPIYEQLRDKYWESYIEFVEWIERELLEHGVDFLDEYLGFINLKQFDEVHLNFSLLELSSSYNFGEGSLHLFIGTMFKEYVEEQKDKNDIDRHLMVYKVFSDKTRFEIIKFLEAKESYGQEIAAKMGITTATVSYHMDYLLSASLIILKRKSRRIYYSLNKEQVRKSIDFLKKEIRL